MRYPASEKLEIIRLVEQSHLGVGSTLDKLGIPKTTFYRWYDRFLAFGDAGLEDRNSSPGRVWNRVPDDVRGQIIDLALEETQLSPRELAVRFTDTRGYFVSEASVYRLLKAHGLITSPAFVVIKAADEFRDKTTAPNQLWQTDFTYLKVIGWGWFYLSTILDDYSRYIIAWKLCTNMTADDVTATLKLALEASESVRGLYVGLQSFRSMSRMDASLMKASALRLRFSQSLASRRQRLSQAMVRSTTQRLGWTTKPFTRSDRLTISVSRSGRMPARAR